MEERDGSVFGVKGLLEFECSWCSYNVHHFFLSFFCGFDLKFGIGRRN